MKRLTRFLIIELAADRGSSEADFKMQLDKAIKIVLDAERKISLETNLSAYAFIAPRLLLEENLLQ